jgi:hypothetical protein
MSEFNKQRLDGRIRRDNRRNSFLCFPVPGSNPVVISNRGESSFCPSIAEQFRATELVPMSLMNEEFGH